MDKKIPPSEVARLEALVDREKQPNTFAYLLLHGVDAALSPWNLTGDYETTEQVYEECLKKQITWDKVITAPPKDAVL